LRSAALRKSAGKPFTDLGRPLGEDLSLAWPLPFASKNTMY
jgi:hypothetical protein